MARGQNKAYEAAEIWAYVDELRRAAGFESEGAFATAADFLPSSLSDWKRGEHVVSSYNLVRLIKAASARRATAPFEAGEAVAPEVAIHSRLVALEEKVGELATRAELQRGLDTLRAAIDALASPDTDSGRSVEHGR